MGDDFGTDVRLLTSGVLGKGQAISFTGPLKNGNAMHLFNFQDGNSRAANRARPLPSIGPGVTSSAIHPGDWSCLVGYVHFMHEHWRSAAAGRSGN